MNRIFRTTSLAAALGGAVLALAPMTAAHAAGEAKNVIFFLGDGMGPVTVTAARIYKGEKLIAAGDKTLVSPERAKLTMQSLPYAARIKTFSLDGQTTDSAPSMAAYMTGVKSRNEVISMDAGAYPYDRANGNRAFTNGEDSTCPASGNGSSAATLLELAKAKGYAVGAVSTTRITHATPAATFSHICNRNGYNTIAEQSVPGHANYNARLLDGVDVLLGGGQRNYLPKASFANSKRADDANLVTAMQAKGYTYVDTGAKLRGVSVPANGKLLGLFSSAEMAYELDRVNQKLDQPSLTEMTKAALDVLSRNSKGFFLMVEGGRIDHALHGTNAKRALEDTLAFDKAIEDALAYMQQKDPGLANTLVVVTADHDHAVAFNGYPKIGNPILGKVVSYNGDGKTPAKAADGLPYTTLVFGNGGVANPNGGSLVNDDDGAPWTAFGPQREATRTDQANMDSTADNFLQEVGIPRGTPGAESHGGGDVMLFATGAGAKIFKGTMENIKVFGKVKEAAGL